MATASSASEVAPRAGPADRAPPSAAAAGRGAWAVLALALPALALAAVVASAVFSARAAIPFSAFSRDPVTELQGPFYVGWLSYAGAVLWCVAAAACLFGWAVVRRTARTPASVTNASFLLASGLLSALLLADDLFMLHDGLFPHVLHVGERKTLAAYGLLVAGYLLRFRRDILATRWAPLAAAFACFALSVAFDVGVLSAGEHRRHMFEDGFKLIGIAWWCTYFLQTSMRLTTASLAPDAGAPLPAAEARDLSLAPLPVPTGVFARVSPARVALVLAAGVALLLAAHTGGQWLKYHRLEGSDAGRYFGMIRRFDLNAEGNVPTWYASALLLLGAALAGYQFLTYAPGGQLTAGWRRLSPWHWPTHRHWLMVGVLLLLMSLDESAELHEKSILPLRKLIGASPWLYYPWVVPAALLVALVGAASLRFLARLPARLRGLLLASAVTYVVGALGMETIGGWYASVHGPDAFPYALLVGAEETLEMAGAVLLVYALLDHLKRGESTAGSVVREKDAAPSQQRR